MTQATFSALALSALVTIAALLLSATPTATQTPFVHSGENLPTVKPKPKPKPKLKPTSATPATKASEQVLSTLTATQPAKTQRTEAGEVYVAGTSAVQLKGYMAEFQQRSTAELKDHLAELEDEVAAGDYFARANAQQLGHGETMAFDDLLKRQEAIHLVLLSRKLQQLKALTAKL